MSDLISWAVLGTISVTAVLWIIWELQPEKVCVSKNEILKKYKGRVQRLNLSELKEIKYHYHAVVGFVSEWEFIDNSGNSLRVDGNAKKIDRVLSSLESILPEFTLTDFNKQFEAGDVEDTLEVWKNA